ncbi:unnamed protein product [Sphagnum tenellum]
MELINVATKGGGGGGVVKSAFQGALLLHPPRFSCQQDLKQLEEKELSSRGHRRGMELSSSPRSSSRPPAIRHVVDSSCRKLKESTTRNLATAMLEELLEEMMVTEEEVVVMMMIGAAAATVEVVYWCLSMTERNPVRTKAITAAILNFLGDFFCQLVIEKDGKVDVKKTAVITFLGLVLVGPMLHIWYLTLRKVFTAMGVKGTVIWLLLDQSFSHLRIVHLTSSPSFSRIGNQQLLQIASFGFHFSSLISLWCPNHYRRLVKTLETSLPFHLPFVAFANVVALAWNIYLSFASHTEVYTAPQTSPFYVSKAGSPISCLWNFQRIRGIHGSRLRI